MGRTESETGLDRPVRLLPGVGPRRAEQLGRLGIETIGDLLLHRPAAYLDRRRVTPIRDLRAGEDATIQGRLARIRTVRTRHGGANAIARIEDATGSIEAVWFRQPWVARALRVGEELLASGRVRAGRGLQILNPEFDRAGARVSSDPASAGGIVPAYRLTAGLSQRMLRKWIVAALREVPHRTDPIPAAARDRLALPDGSRALASLHFPSTPEEAESARRRLALEEVLVLQLLLRRIRTARRTAGRAPEIRSDGPRLARVRDRLPFRLTDAQVRAAGEILGALASTQPANRLLQGDVGSGKTVVAALACAAVADAGAQSCLLAPTEILALQHAETLSQLLAPADLRIGLLVGRTAAARRRALLDRLGSGALDLVVGTHALIPPDVRFSRLGLVIVDEQQRFGVYQRLQVREKGPAPHTLVMSATPIPRTLSLTLYGDLDVSTIDALPPGRTPVRTRLVDRSRWDDLLGFIADRLRGGDQAFFVYPRIEGEEGDLRDATRMAAEISAHPRFAGLQVALLHGRIPPAERGKILEGMRAGRIQALVATTVVEVGLDLPRATILVVEHPDRYGLAQLHQLRGRIGRAPGADPYFFLIRPEEGTGLDRLRVLLREGDGFRVAEEDLRLRGPGELLGSRQTGFPAFRMADLSLDRDLLEEGRRLADRIVEADPELARPAHRALWEEAARRHPAGGRLFPVG